MHPVQAKSWVVTLYIRSAQPTAVSAFAVYVATSLYLLFHPRLLHRRRTDENRGRFRPYAHISHRGGAAESYENTIGGFRQVID